MIQYPMTFKAQAQADANIESPWLVRAGDSQADCSIPPEFGGPGAAFSPEDFFSLAMSNCFVGSFKVYAKASKLSFSKIQAHADLELDREGSSAQAVAKRCRLSIVIEGVEDETRAKMIVKKVIRSGILLNSVKTELSYSVSLNGQSLSIEE